MPIKPNVSKLTASTPEILNTIRTNASANYASMVPYADGSTRNLRAIGEAIMAYQPNQNEFLNALVNRIGRVILTSRMYSNPWAMFKKGMLEYGEAVEEIFVNIAKPFTFDPEVAETNVFKREIPDVRAAFHVLNYQKFYKSTVSNDQLRQAFLSMDGITELIAGIVDAMYKAANYDEFLTMKYMLARNILDGNLYPAQTSELSADNAATIATDIKAISNNLEFLSGTYNKAGVANATAKDDQFLILSSKADSTIAVNVLATSFNMSQAEFMGHRVLINSFALSDYETARLGELFAGDPAYDEIGSDDNKLLDAIPGVIVSRDWFMVFDNFFNFTENYNGEGLYWQYFYHTWKTFSVSPFANAALLTPGAPSITSVSVNPSTANAGKGTALQLTANVATTNFAPKGVVWSSNSEFTTVSANGLVQVGANETNSSVTITATSLYDSSKSGTCVITVTQA